MNRTLLMAGLGLAGLWAYRQWRRHSYDYRDKTVLITGGTRGLGLVMARQLLAQGARVAVCAREPKEVDRAFAELQESSGHVLAVPCDVTDRQRVRELAALVRHRLGPVDVLINDAGIIGVGPLETMRLEDFEAAMRTHFWASLFTTLEVLPDMRARRSGRVVNITSIGGKVPVPHMLPYVASKYAQVGLSEGLRVELASEGISVTTVVPGLMRTGSHLHAEFKGQHRKEYAWFALGDAIPGMSTSAENAARQILDAAARGDAELVFTLPARVAVALHGLCPNLVTNLAGLVERWLLPDPGGIGTEALPGRDSRGALPGAVTTLIDRAAARNNELVPGVHPSTTAAASAL